MPKPNKTPDKALAKELYKKNLDLFNANRSLGLMQKLYQIMTGAFTVEEVANHIIEAICKELDYDSGIVVLKNKKKLQIVAATHSKLNNRVRELAGTSLGKISFSPVDSKNLLIKASSSGKKTSSTDFAKLWFPHIDENKLRNSKAASDLYSTVVLPIKFGNKVLGAFAIVSDRDLTNQSDFEKQILQRVTQVFGLAIDRVSLYQKLRFANKELKRLDKLKDEFVYIATHELKTPVTVMKGYIQMINTGMYGKVPKKILDALAEINEANNQLVLLVNDLLEISKSEVKSIEIKTQPAPLCTIVNEVIDNIDSLAQQKKLKITHSCPKSKIKVHANPDKLTEIINNLISNAIKYSEKGTISVFHVVEDQYIITHVADQGDGISPKDQKKMFKRFFRAEATSQKAPGTGLGLFITKQLVEKMGGRIWFTSKLGVGTTFSFSLPRADLKPKKKK